MDRKIEVIILTLLSFVIARGQQFEFTIHGGDFGGISQTIAYGVDQRATFCKDTLLGEYNSFPPFPFMFTWTNPRVNGFCDADDCFDCGRASAMNGLRPVDFRPFTSPAQIDTYRVSMYSYDGGFPFTISWAGDYSAHCDSMKLIYSGTDAGLVVIDMLNISTIQITDPTVSHADIIKWGAYMPLATTPLIAPQQNAVGTQFPVNFRWRSVKDAMSYQIQVSIDSLFVSPLHHDSTTTDTSKVVSTLGTEESLSYLTSYFWRVRARSVTGTGPWSQVRKFTTLPFQTTVARGWNLISVPLTTEGYRKADYFPVGTSATYAYDPGKGKYISCDSIFPKKAYWLKSSTAQDVSWSGYDNPEDTLAVQLGWNLLGTISRPIPTRSIVSDPPGLITSEFFGYTGWYIPVDTLRPGLGYWVKVQETGSLILSANPPASTLSMSRIQIEASNESPPIPPENITGVRDEVSTQFVLRQNYPNPFNPKTEFKYQIAEANHVMLKIYDVMGREIAILVDENKQPGEYSVTWDASGYSSGIYFYKLEAGRLSNIRKMLLAK